MSFHVIIPARMASTRLPGKMLLPLGGKPLVQHTYERALQSGADSVMIATEDKRVAQLCKEFGAHVIMTSPEHLTGTDRVAEAALKLHLPEHAIVVNVQGDEPFVHPENITQVARHLMQSPKAIMSSLYEPLTQMDAWKSPMCVKVVCDAQDHALYFSRACMPWDRDQPDSLVLAKKHLGLYAYRLGCLKSFQMWPECDLEKVEKLEQLRVLYHGGKIAMAKALHLQPMGGVDTQADYLYAQSLLAAVEETKE